MRCFLADILGTGQETRTGKNAKYAVPRMRQRQQQAHVSALYIFFVSSFFEHLFDQYKVPLGYGLLW